MTLSDLHVVLATGIVQPLVTATAADPWLGVALLCSPGLPGLVHRSPFGIVTGVALGVIGGMAAAGGEWWGPLLWAAAWWFSNFVGATRSQWREKERRDRAFAQSLQAARSSQT